jgi:hypothetical protein
MIATFIFLDPKFTLGALFELLAFHKRYEFLVVLTCCGAYLIFLAGHVFMPLNSAI